MPPPQFFQAMFSQWNVAPRDAKAPKPFFTKPETSTANGSETLKESVFDKVCHLPVLQSDDSRRERCAQRWEGTQVILHQPATSTACGSETLRRSPFGKGCHSAILPSDVFGMERCAPRCEGTQAILHQPATSTACGSETLRRSPFGKGPLRDSSKRCFRDGTLRPKMRRLQAICHKPATSTACGIG